MVGEFGEEWQGVVVLRNDSVHHCLELCIDGVDGGLGELGLQTIPDLLGSILRLPLVSEMSLNFEEHVPKGLVVVIVPVVLSGGTFFRRVHRTGSGDDPSKARCMKEVLHEGCPGQVVGAMELGDSGAERGGGGGGHIEFLVWGEHQ